MARQGRKWIDNVRSSFGRKQRGRHRQITADLGWLSEVEEHSVALIALSANGAKIICDDFYALRLLLALERLLSADLSRGFFSPFTLWEIFDCLRSCLPDGAALLAPIRSRCSSDVGRSRVFLRVALNDGGFSLFFLSLVF